MKEIEDLAHYLDGYKYTFSNEAELQHAIARALSISKQFGKFEREFVFNKRDRIDFWFPSIGVGLEVKTKGSSSPTAMLTQCRRYCDDKRLKGLLLVTARLRLELPPTLNDRPCSTLQLFKHGF